MKVNSIVYSPGLRVYLKLFWTLLLHISPVSLSLISISKIPYLHTTYTYNENDLLYCSYILHMLYWVIGMSLFQTLPRNLNLMLSTEIYHSVDEIDRYRSHFPG